MPRASIDRAVDAQLDQQSERFVDMRIDLVAERNSAVIITAGGVWDTRTKRYVGESEMSRIFRAHEGQIPAAEWFATWLEAHLRGEELYELGQPMTDVLFLGGRRGGKSNLAIALLNTYLVAAPRRIGWIVLPTFEDRPEIDRELDEALPRTWYRAVGDPLFVRYLANGSEMYIKSSFDPETLKRGRADIVIVNEAQKHKVDVYGTVLPAIADKGGLVIMTANPPKNARGEWVAELVEKARAQRVNTRIFTFDPKLNPHVKRNILASLKGKLDDRTYRREVEGEFLPRTDAVFHAYSSEFNLEPVPDGPGITVSFLRRKLNVDAACLHGMDFQKDPHMVAASLRFFEDPEDPGGDPLVWIFDEVLIEQGLEDDLVDALEAHGHTGADAVVADASGEWQDAERTKGRSSWDVLRRRGWRKLFMPDEMSKRNPPIMERIAVGNSLLKSADGKRKLRIDPRCIHTARSVRLWENRNGAPNRRSEHAHIADCWTYPAYRLFPRRSGRGGIEYARVERARSDRQRDLEAF
jgi:hypothetical protein